MKFSVSLMVLFLCVFTPKSWAGFNCHKLIDDDGHLGPKVVTLDYLEMDSDSLSDLWEPLRVEGGTFVKYQYWVDADNGYHMVHFVGISDTLERGAPEMMTLNLFCKKNESEEEGFF